MVVFIGVFVVFLVFLVVFLFVLIIDYRLRLSEGWYEKHLKVVVKLGCALALLVQVGLV